MAICVHCNEQISQKGDLWIDAHGLPGMTQYCWIDPARGSRLHAPRIDVDELANASAGVLHDVLAMVAAADRGEVWVVNAGTRLRIEALQTALANVHA